MIQWHRDPGKFIHYVPLLLAWMLPLVLCLPCLCGLFCCFRGPDRCADWSAMTWRQHVCTHAQNDRPRWPDIKLPSDCRGKTLKSNTVLITVLLYPNMVDTKGRGIAKKLCLDSLVTVVSELSKARSPT